MTTPDAPTPLASEDDFNSSALADLAVNLQPGELAQVMIDATRACEDACGRRLAPFTITETQRLDAGDLDDYGGTSIPLPMAAQMGLDYANALNVGQMVRHCWLREYPPRYQDLWAGSVGEVLIYWPYQSAPYNVPPNTVLYDVDTGHIRFLVGTFVPFGSTGSITYSGGYSTVPGSLARASKSMAGSIIIKELDPTAGNTGHDPGQLRDEAIELLDPYMRN